MERIRHDEGIAAERFMQRSALSKKARPPAGHQAEAQRKRIQRRFRQGMNFFFIIFYIYLPFNRSGGIVMARTTTPPRSG